MHNNDSDPNKRNDGRNDDAEQAAGKGTVEEALIEESLHHALSDLEHILERHESPGQLEGEGLGKRAAADTARDEDREQYVIPLLEEVVIPGTEGYAPAAAPATPGASRALIDHDDEPALRRRLAERLASEIDIITQDRIEAALETAREEIRVQVRNHLDIILPEIVEELNQQRHRTDTSSER